MADNQNITLALLGIAATKTACDQVCPPDNVMSAFIEHRVDKKTHTMMLAHLNQCESCYMTWEQVSVFQAEYSMEPTQQQQKQVTKITFVDKLKDWFDSGHSWHTVVPGVALASLALAIVINIPGNIEQTNNYHSSIIAQANIDSQALALSVGKLPAPWENQTFGFNQSELTSPAKAFGVGLWSAKNSVMSANDSMPMKLVSNPSIAWQDSEFQSYFALGHWTMDAWILAHADQVNSEQWVQLKQILKPLQTKLKQREQLEPEAIIVTKSLAKITALLDRLSQQTDNSAQRDLSREIELGLQRLFLS